MSAFTVSAFDSPEGALLLGVALDLGWKRVRGTGPVGS